MNNLSIIENDKPEKTQDLLDYKLFAQILKNSINSLPSELGFTCAIDGIWGIGKTTLINFLKTEIRKDKEFNYKIIDYSPWNIIDAQKSINEFFALLKQNINEGKKTSKIQRIISNYYKILFEGVKFIPSLNKFSSIIDLISNHFNLKNNTTLASVKNELYEYMRYEYSGKDLLFIIDDVDRLTGNEVMMLMKLIKEIADFPHITYLLSLDKKHVAKSINHFSNYPENDNYGFDYLDKFVQLWWSVPILDISKIKMYFYEKIQQIVQPDEFDKEQNYFLTICNKIIFKNINNITLRKIKILINCFSNNYIKMNIYTNFCDLLAFTWIQLFYPELLTIIIQNSDLMVTNKRKVSIYGLNSTQEYEEEQKNIEINKSRFDYLDALIFSEYQNILCNLFPMFEYNIGVSFSINEKENDLMRFLISTKINFLNYYYQKKNRFIDIYYEIEELMKLGNTNNILEALNTHHEDIENFVSYLYLYNKYKYNEFDLIFLLKALFRFGNTLNENESIFLIGNISDYIYPPPNKSLQLLSDVINKTPSSQINSFLIYFLHSFIVLQNLLLSYDVNQQEYFINSLYFKLKSLRTYRNIRFYHRVLNIFSHINKFDLINNLFSINIKYVIGYIIKIYTDINSTSNSKDSFKTYFVNNTINQQFNLQNFWNQINSAVTIEMINQSSNIKSFRNDIEFNKLSPENQNIIDCYIQDFHI